MALKQNHHPPRRGIRRCVARRRAERSHRDRSR